MTQPKFLTLSRAALLLGLSPRTMLNWVGSGILPAYRPHPKGVYLVDIIEVEAAIKAKTAQEREAPALTKERFRELTDGFKAEIAREKKFTVQQVAPKRGRKAPVQHGETVH